MPAGSFVVKCDQAYRPHVLDMFEPQWHPDDIKDGKPVPPYDAAGWTLAMQMDVQVERCFEALDGPFELLDGVTEYVPASLPRSPDGWRLQAVRQPHGDRGQPPARGRLRRAVEQGRRLVCRRRFGARGNRARRCGARARPCASSKTARGAWMPRHSNACARRGSACLDTFGGHMPTGWDQWTLKEFEFPVQQVWGDRIELGNLGKDFDVIVFHTGLPGPRDLERAAQRRDEENLGKLAAALPKFEDWSNPRGACDAAHGREDAAGARGVRRTGWHADRARRRVREGHPALRACR
jgi:hypothetical protein